MFLYHTYAFHLRIKVYQFDYAYCIYSIFSVRLFWDKKTNIWQSLHYNQL